MEEIKTLKQYDEVMDSKTPALVIWSANWCPDCVFIKPFLPELEKEYPQVKFYMANRDDLLDLAIDLEILGIPSFILYQNGKELGRFVSKLRKTKPEIEAFINESLKKGE